MEKRYQVFVSSTYEDLKEERAGVIKCLLDNNCIPVGMEQFPASSMSQWEYIQKMLSYTDYFILISAGKYGTIDDASNTGLSYTEREYDYAKEKGINILSFVIDKSVDLPKSKIELDSSKIKKLKEFQGKAQKGNLVSFYTNVNDLQAKVVTAINQAIKNTPAIGWVRADGINVHPKSPVIRVEHEAPLSANVPTTTGWTRIDGTNDGSKNPIIRVGHEAPTSENCPPGAIYFQYD